ncbi:hypothetical protein DID75_04265 [Candidatus Marinamargulisbacteria bacterium SCGC AG-410-N11]|nr:hypothetical protein DID75_04265 [Candidatus Marinamargulisbacteria bacterium SCGC AG-410-N11]
MFMNTPNPLINSQKRGTNLQKQPIVTVSETMTTQSQSAAIDISLKYSNLKSKRPKVPAIYRSSPPTAKRMSGKIPLPKFSHTHIKSINPGAIETTTCRISSARTSNDTRCSSLETGSIRCDKKRVFAKAAIKKNTSIACAAAEDSSPLAFSKKSNKNSVSLGIKPYSSTISTNLTKAITKAFNDRFSPQSTRLLFAHGNDNARDLAIKIVQNAADSLFTVPAGFSTPAGQNKDDISVALCDLDGNLGAAHTNSVRHTNYSEDRYFMSEFGLNKQLKVILICDGVSGTPLNGVLANLYVESLQDIINENQFDDLDPDVLIRNIYQALLSKTKKTWDQSFAAQGKCDACTMNLAVYNFNTKKLAFINAGDSPIYFLSNRLYNSKDKVIKRQGKEIPLQFNTKYLTPDGDIIPVMKKDYKYDGRPTIVDNVYSIAVMTDGASEANIHKILIHNVINQFNIEFNNHARSLKQPVSLESIEQFILANPKFACLDRANIKSDILHKFLINSSRKHHLTNHIQEQGSSKRQRN